jgi:HEAT repeat protein
MKRSDTELLDELTAAAIRRGRAFGVGDLALANSEFDRAMKIARELLLRGRPALEGILRLLSHEDPFVRLTAAFLAVEIEPRRGEQVFEDLARRHTDIQIGFTARFTLEQWRTGKLKTLSKWEFPARQ